MTKQTYTVTELSSKVKSTLQPLFPHAIHVIGEVSNKKPSKNNLYFTLRDNESSITAVVWSADTKQLPHFENGDKVKVSGNLVIFAKQSSYNISANSIELLGTGNIHQEYHALKQTYEQLNYFTNKKPKPPTITSIGIITSSEGAALQDFLYVLKKNKFNGNIVIKNTLVQGKDCPQSVESNLKLLDSLDLDVIVITRGGGSFEDLYGFSNPAVVEAIHTANTYIISAIGHEVDFMLSDFVADYRAPTPSLAAEYIADNTAYKYENIAKNILSHIHHKLNTYLSSLNTNFIYQAKNNLHNAIIKKLIEHEQQLTQNISYWYLLDAGTIINDPTNYINKRNKKLILTNNNIKYEIKITKQL